MLNLYNFSDIKEGSRGQAMSLGDEYQKNFLIFIALLLIFIAHCSKVGRRIFDSSNHIYLRRRRLAMELIAAVGTKLQKELTFLRNYISITVPVGCQYKLIWQTSLYYFLNQQRDPPFTKPNTLFLNKSSPWVLEKQELITE